MGTLKPSVPLMYERVDGVVYGRYQGTTDRFKNWRGNETNITKRYKTRAT